MIEPLSEAALAGRCGGSLTLQPARQQLCLAGGIHIRLGWERKPEHRADSFLAFDGHLPAMSLRECFHDGEPQARSTRILRVGFSLVEDFFEQLFGDAPAVVADPALNGAFRAKFSRPDENFSARCVLNGIAD